MGSKSIILKGMHEFMSEHMLSASFMEGIRHDDAIFRTFGHPPGSRAYAAYDIILLEVGMVAIQDDRIFIFDGIF